MSLRKSDVHFDQFFANDVFVSLISSIRLDAAEPFHKRFVPTDSG